MVRKGKWGRIGAKVFAAVLTVAMTFSNVSMALPGGMTLAEEEIVKELDDESFAKEDETKKAETEEASASLGTSETTEPEVKKTEAAEPEVVKTDAANEGSTASEGTEDLVEVTFALQ